MSLLEKHLQSPQGCLGHLALRLHEMQRKAFIDWSFKYIPLQARNHVCDMMCATGGHTARLLQICRNGAVVGVDSRPACVARAQRTNAAEIDRGRCGIMLAEPTNTSFQEESFDVVTFFEGLDNLDSARDQLTEAFRLLRPEGRVAIAEIDRSVFCSESVCGEESLAELLEELGFEEPVIYSKIKKPWICVVARKPKPKPKPRPRPAKKDISPEELEAKRAAAREARAAREAARADGSKGDVSDAPSRPKKPALSPEELEAKRVAAREARAAREAAKAGAEEAASE